MTLWQPGAERVKNKESPCPATWSSVYKGHLLAAGLWLGSIRWSDLDKIWANMLKGQRKEQYFSLYKRTSVSTQQLLPRVQTVSWVCGCTCIFMVFLNFCVIKIELSSSLWRKLNFLVHLFFFMMLHSGEMGNIWSSALFFHRTKVTTLTCRVCVVHVELLQVVIADYSFCTVCLSGRLRQKQLWGCQWASWRGCDAERQST